MAPCRCNSWNHQLPADQPRLYVSFPLALAAAIGLEPGDQVQWELLDRGELHLVRLDPPLAQAKARAQKT